MTSVYSSGPVYEYTQEANNYGLVEIKGNTVHELADFAALRSALAKTPAPNNDGRYKADRKPSDCPARTSNWSVRNNSIPVMPSGAEKYFQSGAGAGVGIKTGDKGSQWAGKPSIGWTDAKSVDSPIKGKSAGSKNSPMAVLLALSAFTVLV